jgi:AsmA protein
MTTEGQGRAADPVGFGIPVIIDGPWAEPRIYPDVAGMLDNPDAAYAKLKEMGKGLFGPGGLGGSDGSGSSGGGLSDILPGKLGETLGKLLQQGLSQGLSQGSNKGANQGRNQGRDVPAPAPGEPPPQPQQDSQPLNDMLRQLFNR